MRPGSVISIFLWLSRAAIASSRMPRYAGPGGQGVPQMVRVHADGAAAADAFVIGPRLSGPSRPFVVIGVNE